MNIINPEKLSRELEDTLIHRECVQRSGIYLAQYLKDNQRGADSTSVILRCQLHDISKMQNLDEFLALASIVDEIDDMYNINHELSEKQKKAISLHWKNNSHHLEHYDSPNDMSRLDMLEMACDLHARSKQFGNNNCSDYIEAQQDVRFHFDKDHYRKLFFYGNLLDDLAYDDDYSDILTKKYNIGFNFTDKTVANLEKFDIAPFDEYIKTDRLYLRRNDKTDFATISYEIHLKEDNIEIGFINIRCTGELEFKIFENYRGNGFAKEALIGVLSRCTLDYLYSKIRDESTAAIKLVKDLGFDYEKSEDCVSRFSTKSLEKVKELGRKS